jgi:chromosome segregation ATPase
MSLIQKQNEQTQSKENEIDFDAIIESAKSMLSNLQSIKIKSESNLHCKFFVYLDKPFVMQFILPYLSFKDMVNFRSTCRDINNTILSFKYFVMHQHNILRRIKQEKRQKKINLNDVNDVINPDLSEDVRAQLESLINVKNFLKEKLFESEKIIKVYRNDLEFLKAESQSHDEALNRLKEVLSKTREENEEIKKENIILKQQLEDMTRKYEDNNREHTKTIDNLKKDIEGLKTDRNKLTNAVINLKKMTDDLKKKNISKSEALIAIKQFFIKSTLLNLKSIPEFNETPTPNPPNQSNK